MNDALRTVGQDDEDKEEAGTVSAKDVVMRYGIYGPRPSFHGDTHRHRGFARAEWGWERTFIKAD